MAPASLSASDCRSSAAVAVVAEGAFQFHKRGDHNIHFIVLLIALLIAALPLDFVSSFEILLFPGRAKSRTFILQYLIWSKFSAEAEYWAMSAATSEVVWLRRLLSDLGVHLTAATPLHCDNNGAIQIATNPVVNERTNNKRSGFTLIYI